MAAEVTSGDTMEEPVEKCSCSSQQADTLAQLSILEQANETLQKKLDGYVRDNENLVIKYAFVEKKVLDLKAVVEEKESKIKKLDHEASGLQRQIGTLKAEKAKLQKNIESKHRDVIRLGKDLEGSRQYAGQVEIRHSNVTCRLRQEMTNRTHLETEVANLRQQLLQHVIAEETHQASEQVAEMERKVMELQAREIMLKHANDEQTTRIGALQRANAEQRDAADRQEKKYQTAIQALKDGEVTNGQLSQQINQLREDFQRQVDRIRELEQQVETAAQAAQESVRMERLVADQQVELEQIGATLDEHRKELEGLKARELELLALNKDLSGVNCLLQQEIASQEAKTIAITLEYGKFVTVCQEYDTQIASLAGSLAVERQNRAEERLLMAKHIADRTRKLEQAEGSLQQTLNELEANRKKYFALAKDFKREMKNVRHVVDANIGQQQ
ncbi:uncharacterized protein LOC128729289 [Anopheles nili]|uniref:uncharacterized protein LOC128729289 n=1 Tax=Anopheles nili TaxID=185578 RepID=UPI00237B5398|nr:uncharacterized protein LOC128729289 [Anopheles nili]